MVQTPATDYLASSPSSTRTHESFSVRLENNSQVDFICLDDPLSTYQVFLRTVLVERQDTIEKSFSNLEENSLI
jgi:hypothetical protein